MFNVSYIHLNLHSEFSVVDGLIRLDQLSQACLDEQMPAIALTDMMNLFALIKFYSACQQKGIKPIIGSQVYLENSASPDEPFIAILLCQNEQGYRHLSELLSAAYLQHENSMLKPVIKIDDLIQKNAGLIVLSGAQQGDVGQAILQNNMKLAQDRAQQWKTIFGDRYYLELHRIDAPNEALYVKEALSLAEILQIPVVATNAVRFLKAEDFAAHEARVAIHQGYTLSDPKRPKQFTKLQYLTSAEEMETRFADIPSALKNSVEIARRCTVSLSFGKVFLPNFPVPLGLTLESYIKTQAEQGLCQRLIPAEKQAIYQARLVTELKVINDMGFAGYFLIVADFIQWAKDQGIPVGPGRGSGAGSLVAYALKITDLDPIQYDLLFERFLNPERVSMPDFDVDFCMEGRDRVIEYVANKYGRDAVSQIITYGTMAAKAVVRDVGRVLGHPYGFVDKLAKLIPFELGMTLNKALSQDLVLKARYENEEEVTVLIDLALKLEGLTRNVGKHAGGVVIAPTRLTQFVPIYREAGEPGIISQFDKDDIEAIGLVKFDFLGLRTLTIIDWAVKNIQFSKDLSLDIHTIPLEDPLTYGLLKACNTTAVFQLESRGMKDLIRRLQPDCFEEIIALVALFRPGPLQSGMVEDFINRKHGRAPIEYPHPDLEPILKPTYGVILYQEQVMQIAQILAGYTLGSADLLRRAMGKKKPEEMAKQRLIFVEGAVARKVDRHLASEIFDLIEKFAGYGFNKSHSAAYALLSYQTAWLKAHYPAEFMAAVLSSDMDNTDKIVHFIEDTRAQGLTILPPDLLTGQYPFTVNTAGQIVYGLGAIKGVGEAAINELLKARTARSFQNLFELCKAVDLRKVNRRVLEALVKSGALDQFGIERSVLYASLDRAVAQAEQQSRDQNSGQQDLFSGAQPELELRYTAATPWRATQKLAYEKESLGLYLSGHPLAHYQSELAFLTNATMAALSSARRQTVLLAGWVVSVRSVITKKGDRMAIMILDDATGRLECAVFSDLYQTARDIIVADQLLVVEAETSVDSLTGQPKLRANRIDTLEQARQRRARGLVLHLESAQMPELMPKLQAVWKSFLKGDCPVYLAYRGAEASARFALGAEWKIHLTDQLIEDLSLLLGEDKVEILYI